MSLGHIAIAPGVHHVQKCSRKGTPPGLTSPLRLLSSRCSFQHNYTPMASPRVIFARERAQLRRVRRSESKSDMMVEKRMPWPPATPTVPTRTDFLAATGSLVRVTPLVRSNSASRRSGNADGSRLRVDAARHRRSTGSRAPEPLPTCLLK
jgi:hypothetical protein